MDQGLDPLGAPPACLIVNGMKFIVMQNTERHGVFVAHLEREAPRLGKAHVVGVAGKVFAYETGLTCHHRQMRFASEPPFTRNGECTFVHREPAGSGPGGALSFLDKATYPARSFTTEDGVRIVPGGSSVRSGAYVARGVVMMPPAHRSPRWQPAGRPSGCP